MKKFVSKISAATALAIAVMMAGGATGCLDEATAPPEAAPAEVAPPEGGEPLTAEQRAELEANPKLQEIREQLARGGSQVELDGARAYQRGESRSIACPVTGPDGKAGQFSHVTVQQRGGGEPSLTLEPTPGYNPQAGQFGSVATSATDGVVCEDTYFLKRVVGRYCDWAWACWLGDATFVVHEAVRTCCIPGVRCWEESTHLTSREHCGC